MIMIMIMIKITFSDDSLYTSENYYFVNDLYFCEYLWMVENTPDVEKEIKRKKLWQGLCQI